MVDGSLKAYVLSEIKDRPGEESKLPVPRLPRLVLRYRAASSRERLLYTLAVATGPNQEPDAERLVKASLALLLSANVGAETDQGEDLGVKLGAPLNEYLGIEPPDGGELADDEAVLLLFEDEVAVVEQAAEVSQIVNESERELVGNSGASS